MPNDTGQADDRRAAFIYELRQLAGFLADHPDIPLPASTVRIQHSIPHHHGDQAQRYAEIVRLAELAGTAFTISKFGCDADLWAGEHLKLFAHTGSDIAHGAWDPDGFARRVAEAALVS